MTRREFINTSARIAAVAGFFGISRLNGSGKIGLNSASNTIENITLNNGVQMPILGFGTLYLNGELGVQCVADAISLGYRLIDTATIYGNETSVGEGIKRSGIDRQELFVTSKNWVDDYGLEATPKAFETSLGKLGLDYLDLYLLHRPRGDINGAWRAMEALYEAGRIRAIGVSNFDEIQLADLMANSRIKPAVNQIETHAFFQQPASWSHLKKSDIQLEAWAPFAEGRNGLFVNETLAVIARKYGKTNAQVSLRWHYQRGIVAIPRSSQKAHMAENLDIFDFQLDDEDMRTISNLDLNKTQFPEWS